MPTIRSNNALGNNKSKGAECFGIPPPFVYSKDVLDVGVCGEVPGRIGIGLLFV